jgi:primosomal replication protein N
VTVTGSAATANQLLLTAVVAELGALRFTPAGLPAIDLRLEHESKDL